MPQKLMAQFESRCGPSRDAARLWMIDEHFAAVACRSTESAVQSRVGDGLTWWVAPVFADCRAKARQLHTFSVFRLPG